MTGFEADVDRLSAHAKDFDGLVERAARISADLAQALEGAPWGDDVVGRSFAAAHAKPASETATRLTGLAADLGRAGGSFAEAARRYQAGDAGAADSIKEL
ncbi:PE domain-containing protein [Amycolatopsis acidiphila]|uniref:PE domain-containing protein n=1 Tax=Amycolatopsis acidiphila TaxID=715473 RepID=A0A557ZWV6_9PSEU|nr:PE domain-containing protein [Amycolatopsis acidiphila]TVT16497.1 PE domain-containing protein [Amycolatopsis acidiphila]UIJ60901.1 PE domain-containing protein [Amycolatopsis acidiphila]GHG95076.1 hypothetical protein GCM10017788_73390 [Amycolatopsis acidiphila]